MSSMTTGITVFICIVVSCGLLYIGYIVGCRRATEKLMYAIGSAMVELGIEPDLVDKVMGRAVELIRNKFKGSVL